MCVQFVFPLNYALFDFVDVITDEADDSHDVFQRVIKERWLINATRQPLSNRGKEEGITTSSWFISFLSVNIFFLVFHKVIKKNSKQREVDFLNRSFHGLRSHSSQLKIHRRTHLGCVFFMPLEVKGFDLSLRPPPSSPDSRHESDTVHIRGITEGCRLCFAHSF